ncbi:hypothetical protein AAVH_09408 [Aphelenchoides avenae]|nr:hypothetical protein AAVH_09408 [Aphelenchus avenae]
MRQPLFVLGLAFVTTVLIANVEARKCYAEGYQWGRKLNGVETVDCDELARELEDKANAPRGTIPRITECATADVTNERGEKWIQRMAFIYEILGSSLHDALQHGLLQRRFDRR